MYTLYNSLQNLCLKAGVFSDYEPLMCLFFHQHICRSSTLAGWGELYGRTGYNYIFSGTTKLLLQGRSPITSGSLPLRLKDQFGSLYECTPLTFFCNRLMMLFSFISCRGQ